MKDRKRRFFDDLACDWDDLYYKDKEIHRKLDEFILKFNIKEGARVLDLGCGTGIISGKLSMLTGKGGRVFCCDFSLSVLKVAKEKKQGDLIFICADAKCLPFKYGFFDSIVCFSCFPHFEDKWKIIKNLSQILKRGGFLVIGHLLSSREIAETHRRVNGAVSRDKMPSKRWMIMNLERTGFKILEFLDKDGFYLLQAEKRLATLRSLSGQKF